MEPETIEERIARHLGQMMEKYEGMDVGLEQFDKLLQSVLADKAVAQIDITGEPVITGAVPQGPDHFVMHTARAASLRVVFVFHRIVDPDAIADVLGDWS